MNRRFSLFSVISLYIELVDGRQSSLQHEREREREEGKGRESINAPAPLSNWVATPHYYGENAKQATPRSLLPPEELLLASAARPQCRITLIRWHPEGTPSSMRMILRLQLVANWNSFECLLEWKGIPSPNLPLVFRQTEVNRLSAVNIFVKIRIC
jgi:hypothetical protein